MKWKKKQKKVRNKLKTWKKLVGNKVAICFFVTEVFRTHHHIFVHFTIFRTLHHISLSRTFIYPPISFIYHFFIYQFYLSTNFFIYHFCSLNFFTIFFLYHLHFFTLLIYSPFSFIKHFNLFTIFIYQTFQFIHHFHVSIFFIYSQLSLI